MKIQNNLLNLLLISTITLMLVACDSKTTGEENNASPAQTTEDTSVDGTDAESNDGTVDTVTANTADDSTATVGGNNNDTTAGNTNVNTTNPVNNNITTTPTTTNLKSLTLSINKSTLNKEENTTVELKATYDDGTSKTLSQNITWIATPNKAVSITNNVLTAKKDRAVTLQAKVGNVLSNKVALNITWVVNGHTLPPEPNPVENDATLLGVDSNNDGVRDDIERKVYATYPKAIQRAVLMQAFRAKQKMLADPDMVDNARVWTRDVSKYMYCAMYLHLYKNQNEMKRKDAELTSEWQFNNKERVKLYMDYNKALSGGVYSIHNPLLQDCKFDVDVVLEMDK